MQELGGAKAFKQAAKLIKALNLGEANESIFTESVFNSTCPPRLIDWCKPNNVKVITCKDVSIANYIEAHEAVMKIVYKQTINLHSNNTYILREASRYSGNNYSSTFKIIFLRQFQPIIYIIYLTFCFIHSYIRSHSWICVFTFAESTCFESS